MRPIGIDLRDEPDEHPVELHATFHVGRCFVRSRLMRRDRQGVFGRGESGIDIGRGARRAAHRRLGEAVETPSHVILELTRSRGQPRERLPEDAALIGHRQQGQEDELRIGELALEDLELVRLDLELRFLEQALGLPEIVRDPAPHVVELAIPTRAPRERASGA